MPNGEKPLCTLALGPNIEGFSDGDILVDGRLVDDDSPLTAAVRAWLLGSEHEIVIDRKEG